MEFSETDEFKKDFKKLAKKYKTLSDDFAILKLAITATPLGSGSKHWNQLKHDGVNKYVMKMRMMCRTVKGTQFRVIYFYDGLSVKVLFIELYFKGDKTRENNQRIEDLFMELAK